MRGGIASIAVAALALGACQIEFVEVDDDPAFLVTVVSDQTDLLRAEVVVEARRVLDPPAVTVEGVEVAAVRKGSGWSYPTEIMVDSADPMVRVRIEIAQPLLIEIPVLARAGAADRAPNGDLLLPLNVGTLPTGAGTGWAVFLADSAGAEFVTIQPADPPVADTLRVDGSRVPDAAVEARIVLIVNHGVDAGTHQLVQAVRSRVRFGIPSAGP